MIQKVYKYTQIAPLTVWHIQHNMNLLNQVVSVLQYGVPTPAIAIIHAIDKNTVQVTFQTPTAGEAVISGLSEDLDIEKREDFEFD